jgi:HPt (histidine-containing phosphotransfer) domain-containing protein
VRMLQVLHDSSANLGATQLVEVCSHLQTAMPNSSTQDCVALLYQLTDAHRAVINELDEIYPAFRLKEKSTEPPDPVPAG